MPNLLGERDKNLKSQAVSKVKSWDRLNHSSFVDTRFVRKFAFYTELFNFHVIQLNKCIRALYIQNGLVSKLEVGQTQKTPSS